MAAVRRLAYHWRHLNYMLLTDYQLVEMRKGNIESSQLIVFEHCELQKSGYDPLTELLSGIPRLCVVQKMEALSWWRAAAL